MITSDYTQIVLLKAGAMFDVIIAGWWGARRGWLSETAGTALSRMVVDMAFPALVFTQMLRTVDATSLRSGWLAPLLMALLIVVSSAPGFLLARWFAPAQQRSTFIFLITIPNWVYLPLPIAAALFGDRGVSTILLGNVGAQLVLWSFGVALLHHDIDMKTVIRGLFANAGIIATVAGITCAVMVPAAHEMTSAAYRPSGFIGLAATIFVQGLDLIGGLTIPLSLLVIGIQLSAIPMGLPHRSVWGVMLGRLVLGPLCWWLVMVLLSWSGVDLDNATRLLLWLVALMPVALSCSVFTDRFGGDSSMAAQAVFWTTLASLATVPAGFALRLWLQ